MAARQQSISNLASFRRVLLFTGAGLSAESGVPTYRGRGGVWKQYNYEDYACQRAFDRNPQQVLDFHEVRRKKMLECAPHSGHAAMARFQAAFGQQRHVHVVTQNIDGLLQRAGVHVDAELHGSIWRVRCDTHGVWEDKDSSLYRSRRCEQCGTVKRDVPMLRPDITWFEDAVDAAVFERAAALVEQCDAFVAIGTSAVVWPAAGFIQQAKSAGAFLVEINPEATDASQLFNVCVREPASLALPRLLAVD